MSGNQECELTLELGAGTEPQGTARGLRWLFATTDFPWPLNHGTWLRIYHLTRMLRALGEDVSVLSYEAADAAGVQAYDRVDVKHVGGLKGDAPSRGRSRCFLGPYVFDANLADRLKEIAGDYDVVVLVRPNMLQYAREAAAAGCVISDMVDDAVLEEWRRFKTDFSPIRCFRRAKFLAGELLYEKQFIQGIHSFVFVSDQDNRNFVQRYPDKHVVTIPNGVDVSYFSSVGECAGDRKHPAVMFLGNMSHPPNEEAAMYLLGEVAPRIENEIKDVRFLIVGSNPSGALLAMAKENVCVTGWVEDVRPYLREASVVLLPMQTGTGIKNKLLEAWASGMAVVCSPLACQGVPVREGENMLVGRTASKLAEATVRLIRDEKLRRKIGSGGQRTVQEKLAWETMAQELRELAEKVRKV
jgi:glycosyltransferase involved in cell wall biosynthesis